MLLVAAALMFGVIKGLAIYTRHGEGIVVPNAKNMTVAQAEMLFRNSGLLCVVTDSTYVKNKPAGCILDHNPAAGQKVKEGRVIYLTINALNIPLRQIPDVADNSSVRQAEARILASGFKLGENEYISGEKDWVYGVKYRGHQLLPGEKVPTGALLTLMVGDGSAPIDSLSVKTDSLNNDSVEEAKASEQVKDDSWF